MSRPLEGQLAMLNLFVLGGVKDKFGGLTLLKGYVFRGKYDRSSTGHLHGVEIHWKVTMDGARIWAIWSYVTLMSFGTRRLLLDYREIFWN